MSMMFADAEGGQTEETFSPVLSRGQESGLDPNLVYEARGYYGDETYINQLVNNTGVGSGTLEQRQNALNILIQQGKDRASSTGGGDNTGGGNNTGGGDNTGGGNNTGGGDNNEDEAFSGMPGAKQILREVLSTYGLGDLYDYAWSLYSNQTIDISDTESFMYALREQEAYKKRFAANERRKALGFNELKPSTYIALEKSYRDTLAANGLPRGFYDSPDDFEKLIGGDVSVAELNNRLKDAYAVVRDASPEVKNKMAEMYGITDGDLLAYVIDPDRARPLMAPDYKRQAQAALIAESAQRLAGINIGKDSAEQFVRQGVTQAEAEAGFTSIRQMKELRRAGFGEEYISDIDLVEGVLGTDADDKMRLEERKKRRIAEVSASGGSATLAQGDSTSYRSGYGQANL